MPLLPLSCKQACFTNTFNPSVTKVGNPPSCMTSFMNVPCNSSLFTPWENYHLSFDFFLKKIKISSSLNIFHTLKQGLFPLLHYFFAQGIYCLFIKINQNCVCSKLFCLRVKKIVSNVTAHSTGLIKLYLVVIWFTVGML